jgi:hypothetical protein
MQEVTLTTLPIYHLGAFDAALRSALPDALIGVSVYGPERPISVWLADTASAADLAMVESVATAHAPVFLTVDKSTIVADGWDAATVTVTAPNPTDTLVTLIIGETAVPVALSDGIGTTLITSVDPVTLTVSLEHPANRSTDQLVIVAE